MIGTYYEAGSAYSFGLILLPFLQTSLNYLFDDSLQDWIALLMFCQKLFTPYYTNFTIYPHTCINKSSSFEKENSIFNEVYSSIKIGPFQCFGMLCGFQLLVIAGILMIRPAERCAYTVIVIVIPANCFEMIQNKRYRQEQIGSAGVSGSQSSIITHRLMTATPSVLQIVPSIMTKVFI